MAVLSCASGKASGTTGGTPLFSVTYENSTARDVRIVPLGDFNGLGSEAIVFRNAGKGVWECAVSPSKGGFHYFEFLVDGKNAVLPDFERLQAWGKPVYGFEVPFDGDFLTGRPAVWLGVGRQDFMLEGVRSMAANLADKNVQVQLMVTEGAHEWLEWRKYLNLFACQLFRPDMQLEELASLGDKTVIR